MSKCPGAGPYRHDTPRFGEFQSEFSAFCRRPNITNSWDIYFEMELFVAEAKDEEIALQALLSHDVRGSAEAPDGLVGDQAPLRARRRASTGAHGPIGSSCGRGVERLLPRGCWRP